MNNIPADASTTQQDVKELAPGIYQLRVPLSDGHAMALDSMNSYLIQGASGWFMIDTGWYTPSGFRAFEDMLHSLGLDIKDISTIVLTHGHPDHYGMAGKIRQHAPEIKLICHRWEADMIESRFIKFNVPREDIAFLLEKHGVPEGDIQVLGSASMPVLELVTVTLPDRVLYGGEIISTGKYNLEVIWTPGHSPGHICLYEPENELLFCGDHVLPTITPNVGYHVLSGDNPLGDYLYSLNKLFHLKVKCTHPGHERSFTDLKARIAAIVEHHRLRGIEVQELIARGFTNSYEIACRLTWSLKIPWEDFSPLQKRAAVTETIAHLEYLRYEGKINKIYRNTRFSYEK